MKSKDPSESTAFLGGFGAPCISVPWHHELCGVSPTKHESPYRRTHLFCMEFRQLGRSGLKLPALSFGTGTFGGGTEFFRAWGSSDVAEATRLVSICLEAGVSLFDTADVYSAGLSEEILGKAIEGRRQDVLILTKASFRMGKGPNDLGSSRII
jgi:aldo/keto reductase family protein